MPDRSGIEDWIVLNDFTAGIFSDYFAKSAAELVSSPSTTVPAKDGALQEAGTYGCIAGKNGGLFPMPKVRSYLQDESFWALDVPSDPQDLIPLKWPDWEPSWKKGSINAPVRVPIIAARVMPAFVGPARSVNEDIPVTEPLSRNPLVLWSPGGDINTSYRLDDISGHGADAFYTSTPKNSPWGLCAATQNVVLAKNVSRTPATAVFSWGIFVRKCDSVPTFVRFSLMENDGSTSIAGNEMMGFTVQGNQVHVDAYTAAGAIYETADDFSGTPTTTLNNGSWHLLSATYDVATDTLTLFIDGVATLTDTVSSGVLNYSPTGGTGIDIHKGTGWEVFGPMYFGSLLSASDWLAIYNSIGPPIANFTPGTVTPGVRPDLTSGDIAFPGIIAVTYDFYRDSGGAADYDERMISRIYKAWNINPQNGPNIFSSTYYYDMADTTVSGSFVIPGQRIMGWSNFDFTRSRHADPTIVGPPFLTALHAPFNASEANKKLFVFPDPDTLTTDSIQNITTGYIFGHVAHQNRVMYVGHSTAEGVNIPFGTSSAMTAFERWGWAKANDFETIELALNSGTAFVPENPFGYGSWCSINAQELLLIKQMGGGVIVRGDVNSPTVVRLPGMSPTHNFFNLGCNTPYGYVYGSNRGVWLWTGGDQSTLLSPQLAGRCLIADDESVDDYAGLKGSFAHIEPYIFAPNSWLFDTRTESWWRLRNHPDIEGIDAVEHRSIFYDVDTLGRVYAFPSYLSLGQSARGMNVFCQVYDLDMGESKFQARTQPLNRSRNRELRIRQVVIEAQGHGTVTIGITQLDGSEQSVDFNVDSDAPTFYRQGISAAVYNAVCRILSDSGDPDSPAPTVLQVFLGHGQRQQVG